MYKELLLKFTSTGGAIKERDWTSKIQAAGDYYYATDKHSCVRVPQAPQVIDDAAGDRTVKSFADVWDNVHWHDPEDITIEQVDSVLLHIDKVPQVVYCKSCAGRGERKCDMDCIHECPDCDGSGDYEDESLPYVYPSYSPDTPLIKVGAHLLAPFCFARLQQVMHYTASKRIAKIGGTVESSRLALAFNDGDVQFLLMGVFPDYGSEIQVIDFYHHNAGIVSDRFGTNFK